MKLRSHPAFSKAGKETSPTRGFVSTGHALASCPSFMGSQAVTPLKPCLLLALSTHQQMLPVDYVGLCHFYLKQGKKEDISDPVLLFEVRNASIFLSNLLFSTGGTRLSSCSLDKLV